MKRVLIITYYWPPSSGSGVQRWLKFSKYLPEFGWQPVIYTPSNPDTDLADSTLERDIPEGAEIVRRRIVEPYAIFRMFSSVGKSETSGNRAAKPLRKVLSEKTETSTAPVNSCSAPATPAGTVHTVSSAVNPINAVGKKSLTMRFSLWIRANIFVPDPRCMWIGPSVRFLKKYLEEHPVDVIVSTGPPHSMHLIARRLHRRTGIKWIADFRDPWTKIFYFKHLPMLKSVAARHARLENGVLREADAVVSVTDLITRQLESAVVGNVSAGDKCRTDGTGSHRSDQNKTGPEEVNAASRFHTVENGYDEADFPTGVVQNPYFTLTHTGVFSVEGNPDMLWKVLGDLCRELPDFRKDLRIVLAGKTDKEVLDDIGRNGLASTLTNYGYVRHSESNRLQLQSRLLLLPLRKEPEADGILTGKYFEYLASGRPIAAFGPEGGALDLSLQKTKAGRLFGWEDYDSLRTYILALYTGYRNSVNGSGNGSDMAADGENDSCNGKKNTLPAGLNPNREEISKYSRRSLTARMVQLLDSLQD